MESKQTLKLIIEVAANVIEVLFNLIFSFTPFKVPHLRIRPDDRTGIKLSIGEEPSKLPIDDRLAKIEIARASLHDALGAIDELKNRAEENKRDLEYLNSQIQRVTLHKETLDGEVQALKGISSLDSEAVRKVLHLPTRVSIWTERVISFFFGFMASVIASIAYEHVIKRWL